MTALLALLTVRRAVDAAAPRGISGPWGYSQAMDPERWMAVRTKSVQRVQSMTMDGRKCPRCKRKYALLSESNEVYARIHCKWSDCDYVREYHREK